MVNKSIFQREKKYFLRVLTRVSAFAEEIAQERFDTQLSVREGGEIGTMVRSILAIPASLNDTGALPRL